MKAFLIIFLAFLMTSCMQQVNKPSPEINTVKKGSTFYINLPENHTTGYLWQLSPKFDNQILDYINSVFHGNEKGVHFNFEAVASGKTRLDFTLIKYRDTTEVQSFIIEVQ